MLLEPIRHHLIEQGLLGEKAGQYGGPDEVMLVSAGPTSHLSQLSLLCGPAIRRVIIRQPSRDVVEAAKEHSPLSGETKLVDSAPFLFERETWDGMQWQLDASTTTASLADGLRQLCSKSDSNFLGTIPESMPFVGPFWTGALSYDLLQLTQPIRLQHLPEEGELLCVLWEIHHCIVHEKSNDSLVVLSTDPNWEANVRAAIGRDLPEYASPTVRLSQNPLRRARIKNMRILYAESILQSSMVSCTN